MTADEFRERFRKLFQNEPQIFRAPGRVNIIGEHTDYNDGFVLPCAIQFATLVAIAPRPDRKLVIQSAEFDQAFEFDLEHLPSKSQGVWSDYLVGVAVILRNAGHALQGASLVVHGTVPIGAGLSSSASVEVATALALLSLTKEELQLQEIARLCQKAENEFVGARCGIMDQFVCCLGKSGHALLLDCRSLNFELVPLPARLKLMICNTMVKHELSGGEYNRRREECEEGVKIISRSLPGIRALRDVTPQQLAALADDMSPSIYKRCLHVVEENARVLRAAEMFQSGNLSEMKKLLSESHRSLRDLYEVSCRELDIMVEAAEGLPGYYGGRMTGGGFGGCTVNLVADEHAEKFGETVADRYREKTGITPEIYTCSAADGARLEPKTATL